MRVLFLTFMVFLTLPCSGQKGPGGVGHTNGSSHLDHWFDAFDLDADGNGEGLSETGLSGSLVTDWTDKSGVGFHMTPYSTGNPTYVVSGLNGYPYILFDGTEATTLHNNSKVHDNAIYVFAVSIHPSANQVVYRGHDDNHQLFSDGSAALAMRHGSATITDANTTAGGAVITRAFFNGSGLDQFHVNHNTGNSAHAGDDIATELNFGRGQSGNHLSGYIAEYITFTDELNEAQSIIVHNYLAAKYNIDIADDDVYHHDDETHGHYDHDVAGIGRVNASNIHNDSQGTGMVRIQNPSDLDDGEFKMWGHDNGEARAIELNDVPSGVSSRFERVWRVTEVNRSGSAVDVGSVDIIFDFSAFSPITTSDLRLLVDTDNDGIFADETPISGASSLGDGLYKFSGVSALGHHARFTVGTADSNDTPLPIKLISFTAHQNQSGHVELNWKTSWEKDNSHFTIERSNDLMNFEPISKVSGADNSYKELSYKAMDYSPLTGNSYYRLKQTDHNGQQSHSEIVRVFIEGKRHGYKLYPNPVGRGHNLYLTSNDANFKNELLTIFIKKPSGQLVWKEQFHQSSQMYHEMLTRYLQPGMYIMSIEESPGQSTRLRFIVN